MENDGLLAELKEASSQVKVVRGNKCKPYYIVTNKFWNLVEKLKQNPEKRKIIKQLLDNQNNKLNLRVFDAWLYHKRKPEIVDEFIENPQNTRENNLCTHGFNYLCPICKINKLEKEEAWEFFFKKENLILKNYKGKIDFSDGVPINFQLFPEG